MIQRAVLANGVHNAAFAAAALQAAAVIQQAVPVDADRRPPTQDR